MVLGPGRWGDSGDSMVGHVGQAGQHIMEISEGIQPSASAVFNDSINDSAALAGIGVADEQPVLLVIESFR